MHTINYNNYYHWCQKHMKSGEAMNGVCCAALINVEGLAGVKDDKGDAAAWI